MTTPSEIYEHVREFFRRRRTSYVSTFRGPAGEDVLRDLAAFCRAHTSTANADPHVAARLDGRREVWLRIQSYLNLPDDKLWDLYGKTKGT